MSTFAFTFDLEDFRERYSPGERYAGVTEGLLERLSIEGIRGTFFVVARLALANPRLIKLIRNNGHEIACHNLDHVPLDQMPPEAAKQALRDAKHILEDIGGEAVVGFRAPIFSLVPRTSWAIDTLRELGYRYSSSVLPAANPLYGFDGAPKTPFVWPNGLVELPCPVFGLGSVLVPYLGGVYLRYLPRFAVRAVASRADKDAFLWTYVHPYDFDADDTYGRFPGTTMWMSVLLWRNRRRTFARILNIPGVRDSVRMKDWVDIAAQGLPVFSSGYSS